MCGAAIKGSLKVDSIDKETYLDHFVHDVMNGCFYYQDFFSLLCRNSIYSKALVIHNGIVTSGTHYNN